MRNSKTTGTYTFHKRTLILYVRVINEIMQHSNNCFIDNICFTNTLWFKQAHVYKAILYA